MCSILPHYRKPGFKSDWMTLHIICLRFADLNRNNVFSCFKIRFVLLYVTTTALCSDPQYRMKLYIKHVSASKVLNKDTIR
jgi:hypothetical protein